MARMPRPRVHSTDAILDAARALLLTGARRATVAEIAAISGAPKGSIYHRFGSLEELLARLWIRAIRRFQAGFLNALVAEDPHQAALAGALWMHDFSELHPADARLLASLRREDLIESIHNPDLRHELEGLNDEVTRKMRNLARGLYGRAGSTAMVRTRLAVVDLAHGAVRRYLLAGQPMPPGLREQIAVAVQAVLNTAEASQPDETVAAP